MISNLLIYSKADKSTHSTYSNPKTHGNDVIFRMSYKGHVITCTEEQDQSSHFGRKHYVWRANRIKGFASVTLDEADNEAMEHLFRSGGNYTPGEFKKAELPKASKAFDAIIAVWHDLIVHGGAKTYAKATAELKAQMAQAQTKPAKQTKKKTR